MDDSWYARKVATEEARTELVNFWLHFGLDDPLILPDLVALSRNMADSRKGDEATYEFVHGRAHTALFSHFCVALAPLATSCVIVELLFSQMKSLQAANETSSSVDDLLFLVFNVLGDSRKERREMLAHTKGEGARRHLHTREQIQALCKQALEMIRRYDAEVMVTALPSKASLAGSHKAKDTETAQHCAEVKNKKKTTRKTKVLTTEEWEARRVASQALPLAVQTTETKINAITQNQRLFAVMMEETILGQVDKKGVFWNKLTGGKNGLLGEMQSGLPFVRSLLKVRRGGFSGRRAKNSYRILKFL